MLQDYFQLEVSCGDVNHILSGKVTITFTRIIAQKHWNMSGFNGSKIDSNRFPRYTDYAITWEIATMEIPMADWDFSSFLRRLVLKECGFVKRPTWSNWYTHCKSFAEPIPAKRRKGPNFMNFSLKFLQEGMDRIWEDFKWKMDGSCFCTNGIQKLQIWRCRRLERRALFGDAGWVLILEYWKFYTRWRVPYDHIVVGVGKFDWTQKSAF